MIRLIAIFEFLKGLAALIVAVGLFDLIKERKIFLINEFLLHAHPHALRKISRVIVLKVESLDQHEAKLILAFGIMYSGLRLVEGYGLWVHENWGRQLGIWSALLYLPFEIYEIIHHFSWVKVMVTIINVGVVVYLWISR